MPQNMLFPTARGCAGKSWRDGVRSSISPFSIPPPSQKTFGALVVTISVIAMGEPVRLLRYLNIPAAAGFVIGAFLTGSSMIVMVHAFAAGAVIAALNVPRGTIRERFGSWDRFVR